MTGSILGFSLPNFWVGLMLIMVFAVLLPTHRLRLPASGRGATVDVLGVQALVPDARRAAAPAPAGAHARALQGRAGRCAWPAPARARCCCMDYVSFARAKGLTRQPHRRRPRPEEHHDPGRHGARPRARLDDRLRRGHRDVFAWPGMGKLLIDSILRLDRPVIVAYLMVIVFFFVADQPRGRSALLGARSARVSPAKAAAS